MKKIIFFDGDGTLWYPKKTKFNEKPWWVYNDSKTKLNPNKHQILMPDVRKSLGKLKSKGIILVAISTQPQSTKAKRDANLINKLRYFKIEKFFDDIISSKIIANHSKPDTKDKSMLFILKKRNIPKSQALMIGDSYMHDYLPARKIGIDCVLIEGFKHTKGDKKRQRLSKKIKNLPGIFRYL